MSDIEAQIALEKSYVSRGVNRYFVSLDKDISKGREMDHSTVEHVLRPCLRALVPAISALQVEGYTKVMASVTSGRRLRGWEKPIQALSPEVMSYVVLKTLMVAAKDEHRVQRVSMNIGRMLNLEAKWKTAKGLESTAARTEERPNRIQALKRKVREVNPKSVRKWLKQLDDLELEDWGGHIHFQVGAALLSVALDTVPELVTREDIREGRKLTSRVMLTQEATDRFLRAHDYAAELRPWLLPMTVPPRPWVSTEDGIEGGYLELDLKVLKASYYKHTSVDGIPPEVLEALNAIQETPWVINQSVLRVAQLLVKEDRGPLSYGSFMEMPPSVPDETWEVMSSSEKGQMRAARARVHDHNNRTQAKKMSTLRVLSVAEEFAEYPAIYFPHSIDWRGRAYPLPQDLHPQADDFTRSLLRFATGKPLGLEGLRWLEYTAAATWGLDKADRTTQSLWVQEHYRDIIRAGRSPEGSTWWHQADEPWQFLAVCMELHGAWDSGAPTDYISHLPVAIDGTCNGLQHLSAMGLDPIGGAAVNLRPGPRQDIYQIVADRVHVLENSPWYGRISRKVVKRPVMTTPYGVTKRGIRDQLLKDGHTQGLQGEHMDNANELTNLLSEAIASVVVKGTEVMAWFQDCAEILAKEGEGIQWTTPIGMTCRQHYVNKAVHRQPTLMGTFTLPKEGTETPALGKQKQSIAPNIIHSFDAAHMMLTVLYTKDATEGSMSYSMVHDSFGCHAADVPVMAEAVRKTFVEVYSEDWFTNLRTDFMFMSKSMPPLPEPPARGDLDITEVLTSEYFFS